MRAFPGENWDWKGESATPKRTSAILVFPSASDSDVELCFCFLGGKTTKGKSGWACRRKILWIALNMNDTYSSACCMWHRYLTSALPAMLRQHMFGHASLQGMAWTGEWHEPARFGMMPRGFPVGLMQSILTFRWGCGHCGGGGQSWGSPLGRWNRFEVMSDSL